MGPNQTAAIESADQAIASFAPRFESAHLIGLRRKLGLKTEQEGDDELIQDLLSHMQEGGADWTLTFRALADAAEGNAASARANSAPALHGTPGMSAGTRASFTSPAFRPSAPP